MIHLTLPYPPTINHLYGQRGSRKFIKKPGVAFRNAVAEIVNEKNLETITGRVCVFVSAYMPDRRKRDLMNLEKILSDSLTHAGVWEDDSQIDDFRIVRREIVKGGKVEVVIVEMGD